MIKHFLTALFLTVIVCFTLLASDVFGNTNGLSSHDMRNRQYRTKFPSSREISDIRMDVYDKKVLLPIIIDNHQGGEEIDILTMEQNIRAVLQRMPNLYITDELVALLYETAMIESRVGLAKPGRGSRGNYGMYQFRLDSAKYILNWLKKNRPDVYTSVMSFYDDKVSLKDNLIYQVDFSIALAAQYYWVRVPDIYSHITDVVSRGMVYKSEYNTSAGYATINSYVSLIRKTYREYGIKIASK